MIKNKLHQIIIKGLLPVVISILAFNSCGEPQKHSLRLQWFHLAQFAGFYSAQDNGYYLDNGIDLLINPGGPDFNAIQLVANSSETFGVWTADQILIAQSKGIPITIIGTIYREDPNVLMVKSQSEIYTPKDFIGKKITTVFGRSTETVLRALLEKEKINEKDVIIEPFPFNIQSFLSGNVDVSAAYSYDHPYQAQKAGQDVRLIKPSDYGVKFYSDCIFTRNELLENNPELVQAFVSATLKGWEFALANKDSAISTVLNFAPHLDRESQLYMLIEAESLIKSENPSQLGLINPNSIKQMVEILKEQKQLTSDFDPSKAFTNKFISEYYDKK